MLTGEADRSWRQQEGIWMPETQTDETGFLGLESGRKSFQPKPSLRCFRIFLLLLFNNTFAFYIPPCLRLIYGNLGGAGAAGDGVSGTHILSYGAVNINAADLDQRASSVVSLKNISTNAFAAARMAVVVFAGDKRLHSARVLFFCTVLLGELSQLRYDLFLTIRSPLSLSTILNLKSSPNPSINRKWMSLCPGHFLPGLC